jgi:4-amino-4-deoxy-L-arabinose transferase-like glycosyltransferase
MLHRLDCRVTHHFLLAAVWALLCLPNLGGPALWEIDEGNNAECFREMLDSGNLVLPTFNYQIRDDKPALLYWLQIACAQVVGVNEWAARLPSALAALMTLLTVYELGRRMFGARAGLWAGLVLATSFAFLGAAHFANPDALLVALGTLALALFWHDVDSGGRGWLGGVGAAAGLAVLAKGPVGLVLPAGVAIFFLVWQRRLRNLCDWRLGWFLLLFLLVAVPWYALVTAETKGLWLKGFWEKHNLARAATSLEGHSGPWYYYALVLLAGLAPWSGFAAAAAWHGWQRLRQGDEPERAAVRFLTVWFALYVVFFSVVRTKLPNYVLPVYPATALLTGHLLERWRLGAAELPAWLVRAALALPALAGVAVTVGLLVVGGLGQWPALRDRHVPGATPWAWTGAVLVAGAVLATWWYEKGGRGGVIAAVTGSTVLFVLSLLGWGIEAVDGQRAPRALARALPADHAQREVRLAAWQWFQPSIVFYSRREVQRLVDAQQALDFLEQPLPAYLFVPEQTWSEVRRTRAVQARVVGRRQDLYTGRVIVVVSNEAAAKGKKVLSSRKEPEGAMKER